MFPSTAESFSRSEITLADQDNDCKTPLRISRFGQIPEKLQPPIRNQLTDLRPQ